MWPQQISRISVIPSTAVTILQPGETVGIPPSAPYKVAFVAVPKPGVSAAAFRQLVANLTTQTEVMVMEVALIQHGLQMMHTSTFVTLFIMVPIPAWYNPVVVVTLTTAHSGYWYGLDLWLIIVLTIIAFALLVAPAAIVIRNRVIEGRWGFYSLIQRTKASKA
jgi:hypothetical protein